MSPIVRQIVVTLTVTAAPFLIMIGVATAHVEAQEPLPHQATHATQD
ncbi:hypothetical protein [Mycolicibacterium goodii]|uniref:Uncharacterized protein n=1 Tax=Mycolicibacterium goodii TaxID=134601 RepID=A0ABS6HMZ6_MYCGD|nr:hypothetical protein [Mycolicibacterium goodii]MBU8808806.1 hypothetical protein [Mycolicibacterium goodii]MBU8817313.1 hypothetical protein [Mycolicibacterium goodii]MBU8824067.1 hypothetical protein [Mycolicibacterium goodii]MBU8832910.1 hypothetical protein [Mycolicibacterium goodii]MBU8840359.1 hypothetical protein [Mycolicibacterium goodii]